MKTIKKKNPVLEFDPVFTDTEDAQTYEISIGSQRLGHVTYEKSGGALLILDLFVEPEFSAFGVEEQILDALLASDEVFTVSVIAPLSLVGLYEAAGFVCDPKHVVLHKKK